MAATRIYSLLQRLSLELSCATQSGGKMFHSHNFYVITDFMLFITFRFQVFRTYKWETSKHRTLTQIGAGKPSGHICPETVRRSVTYNSQVVFRGIIIIWFCWWPSCESTATHNCSIQPLKAFSSWTSSTWTRD